MSRRASSGPPKWTPPRSTRRSSSWARARCCFRRSCRCFPSKGRRRASCARRSEDWIFSHDYADRTLREHFKLLSLDGCGLAGRHAAVCAAGAILHYLRETQRAALDHLDPPTLYDRADSMVLDGVTVRNLELVEPLFAAEGGATLLAVLDQTQTGMGGRLLRQRLLRPSMDRAEIEARLDAVGELAQQTILRAELRKHLEGVLDIERLLAKVTLGTAGPRDVLALGRSLEKIPPLKRCFDTQQSARLRRIYEALDEVPEVRDRILDAIADEPPLNVADGGTIRAGYQRRTGRAARPEPQRAAVHRADRGARARPHRHRSRSRCASTTSSATTSKSRRPTCTWRRPITSASRRSSTPSASPRRS